jgi:DNA-directed RNA polymerase specialized sigma24 family protein
MKEKGMVPEDVRQFFTGEMTGVLRLALHLTADAEKAETCLILAMRDCIERSTVSKEWLPRWARRMVVRNAIRLVLAKETETRHETGFTFYPRASDDLTDSLRESVEILQLDDFDRLAFVICVFERYALMDCALLMRTTPNNVKAAIARARNQLLAGERNDQVDAGALPLGTAGPCLDE